MDLGIEEKEVDSTIELLPKIGSEGVLRFPAMDLSSRTGTKSRKRYSIPKDPLRRHLLCQQPKVAPL